jgi:hypothetical protein
MTPARLAQLASRGNPNWLWPLIGFAALAAMSTSICDGTSKSAVKEFGDNLEQKLHCVSIGA